MKNDNNKQSKSLKDTNKTNSKMTNSSYNNSNSKSAKNKNDIGFEDEDNLTDTDNKNCR